MKNAILDLIEDIDRKNGTDASAFLLASLYGTQPENVKGIDMTDKGMYITIDEYDEVYFLDFDDCQSEIEFLSHKRDTL